MVDPGEGARPIARGQVERSSAERCGLLDPTTVEEKAAIVEGTPSALRGHVTRRAIEMEPGEALGPSARDASILFEDRRRTIKGCVGGSPRNRRRRSTWSAIPE
jgi:hypothetical protein